MDNDSLQDFVEEVNGGSHLRVEHDYGDGFVRLRTSEAERRQAAQDIQGSENIVLELLRNSRDAHASHIFVAIAKEADKRSIVVIDDGDGIPNSMHSLVFEPRVTSKLDTSHMDAWGLHGRGMALFSISQNSESARVAASAKGMGCSISVQTDTRKLGEKTDQSSFPRFLMGENGHVNIRGPRNILRTACEFAIESRATCSVYVGSPTEIAATIYAFGNTTLSAIERAFCKDVESLPVAKRLATASDPQDFADIAETLGLPLSQRTARRIIDGQIADIEPLLDQVKIEQEGGKPAKRKGTRNAPAHVRMQRSDALQLAASAKESFADFAARYYLEEDVDPVVRVMRDKVVISIPLVEKSE